MNQSPEKPSELTPLERFVETPEGRCRVRILGRGPAVFCLHGVSAQGRSWMEVARRLGQRATFVMPDLIGRGASDALPHGSFTLEHETDRAESIIEGLLRDLDWPGDDRIGGAPGFPSVLAGHSQGAAIALGLAARRSGVRGLLLSNPVTPWTARPAILGALRSGLFRKVAAGIFSPLRRRLAATIIGRAGGPRFRAPPDLVEKYAEPYADARRAETLMALLRDWDPAELEGVTLRTDVVVRVVTGARDPRIDRHAAERLAERMGASFRVLEDGGHILPEQYPDVMAEELGRVLDATGIYPSR